MLVFTRAIDDRFKEDAKFKDFVTVCIYRHGKNDWGDMCDEDKEANDEALKDGGRLMSSFNYEDTNVWIITEADRRVTTVLFPEDY